jgi:hypothetical protein
MRTPFGCAYFAAMPIKHDRGSPLWGVTPKHERLWPTAVRIAVWVACGFATWGLIAGVGWLVGSLA